MELGATVPRPARNQFYGERDGHIIDPFGMAGPSRRTFILVAIFALKAHVFNANLWGR